MTPKMTKSFLFISSVFLFANCAQSPTNSRSIATNTLLDSKGRELGLEVVPANEAESSKEIIGFIKEGYAHYKPKDLNPAAHRIIHGKQHGCVRAEFQVEKNLPKEFSYGIFSNSNMSYPAWIRFSNGAGSPGHDGMPDARGLAIKLMDVEGQKLSDEVNTQDFLLQSSPVFFVPDVAAYVKFMKFKAHSTISGVGELLSTIKPTDVKLLAMDSAALINNPLTAYYFSALPQKLGPQAMKLRARACSDQKESKFSSPNKLHPNFLQEVMAKELTKKDACIELAVQRQVDAELMPIENATVKWEESLSPFVTVAHIKIPKQNFLSEKRMEFCENISFNPWNTIPEHQPIGGLNRVRKMVYDNSSKLRHDLNNHTYQVPTPDSEE